MDRDAFWKINEGLPAEEPEAVLETRLAELPPDEIASYQRHFDEVFVTAYDWRLWGAAYIIEGGCSDDAFMDFRHGLIARGRVVFEAALKDTDSLADIASDDDDGYLFQEGVGYVARQVFAEKTGGEMPETGAAFPADPSGEDWDFDDEAACAERLPRLWAKFGG